MEVQLDWSLKTERTLMALRIHDPSISEIISDGSHIALYSMQTGMTSWEKMPVEGASFIVRRTIAPYGMFIVLNRLATENWVLDLSSVSNVKLLGPYILIRYSISSHCEPEIVGVWCHNEEERKQMKASISEAVRNAKDYTTETKSQKSKPLTTATCSSTVASSLLLKSMLKVGPAP
jgi:hypothetical protein